MKKTKSVSQKLINYYYTVERLNQINSQLIKINEFESGDLKKEILKTDLNMICLAHLMQFLNELPEDKDKHKK